VDAGPARRREPDLLREMIKMFAEALMGAEACQARSDVQRRYLERTAERTNSRNGYGRSGWDTRAGTIELAIQKLRSGSYFPDWLLEDAAGPRPP
jgi:putative transposase